MIYMGIDPGKINLGVAVVDFSKTATPKLLYSKTCNPASSGMTALVDTLIDLIPALKVRSVVIERYVPYQGVYSPDTERITMLIGALMYGVHLKSVGLDLVRAFDWKSALSKALYKSRNFRNPSAALDKKFSIAAARCCLNVDETLSDSQAGFQTDHEADAICLASLPFISKDMRK